MSVMKNMNLKPRSKIGKRFSDYSAGLKEDKNDYLR